MLTYGKMTLPGGSKLLRAALTWAISALILLLLAAAIANAAKVGERGLAYLSSAISFLAAAAAGAALSEKGASSGLLTALIGATVLVILLLTAGFVIGEESLNPSSVISLVSFTYAGVLFGFCALPGKGKSSAKRRNMR